MQHTSRNNRIPKVKVIRASKEPTNTISIRTALELKLETIIAPSIVFKRLPNIRAVAPSIGKPRPQVS